MFNSKWLRMNLLKRRMIRRRFVSKLIEQSYALTQIDNPIIETIIQSLLSLNIYIVYFDFASNKTENDYEWFRMF